MTPTLIVALFAEGNTDERFLPVIIERTLESLLRRYERKFTEVVSPYIIKPSRPYRDNADRILALAEESCGYHMLIIHADADHPTAERALNERFQPGLDLVQAARERGVAVCEQIIPAIPIQMIEAWMIADVRVLHEIIGTNIAPDELGLPLHPHQVESISDPKQRLLQAVTKALADRPRRRRNPQQEIRTLQTSLGGQIRLEELRRVPAFADFESRLHQALRALQLAD